MFQKWNFLKFPPPLPIGLGVLNILMKISGKIIEIEIKHPKNKKNEKNAPDFKHLNCMNALYGWFG